ncbi:MAG: hypothetical protein KAJ75_02760, partial [Alphaproteobacteria bacterium]|nr:hypothetical protein [Alphaproteobacteria bacterium]
MNMIRKSEDGTLARNNVKLMLRLIDEYEAIKAKKQGLSRYEIFDILKSLNMLKSRYNIQFAEVLSDNGPEFGSGRHAKNKQ